jgi:hypothetical protein
MDVSKSKEEKKPAMVGSIAGKKRVSHYIVFLMISKVSRVVYSSSIEGRMKGFIQKYHR